MSEARCLIVTGAQGSGRTTLLRWMALTVASGLAQQQLGLVGCHVPVLVPLHILGKHVADEADSLGSAPAWFMSFLEEYFAGWKLRLPGGFFAQVAGAGRAIFLFDGLDEVADRDVRDVVVQVIRAFAARYARNRYVITSRAGGYLAEGFFGSAFKRSAICSLSDQEVERFVSKWYLAVETTMEDDSITRERAREHTVALLGCVLGNDRMRRLVTTPLSLTMTALVHQDRMRLPPRRTELYDAYVQLLMDFWDIQSGCGPVHRFSQLDRLEKRTILESVALRNHDLRRPQEVEMVDLRLWLREELRIVGDPEPRRGAGLFLDMIDQRDGVLARDEPGTYRFLHVTFQEYLAARAVADRDDYIEYTLARRQDPWWQRVILLEAGHLSMSRSHRARRLVTDLVKAIWKADEGSPTEQTLEAMLRNNLLLAGRCLALTGPAGVERSVWEGIVSELEDVLGTTPFSRLRNEVMLLLTRLGVESSTSQMVTDLTRTRLETDGWPDRAAATTSLGQLDQPSPHAVRALVTALGDVSPGVRAAAARRLGRIGQTEEEVVEALAGALVDEALQVRYLAAATLVQLGETNAEAVEALMGALRVRALPVRNETLNDQGHLSRAGGAMTEMLLEALANTDPAVRFAGAAIMGQLDRATGEVVKLLIRALTDDERPVRCAAASSLEQLALVDRERILRGLLPVFSEPLFRKPDSVGRAAYDYAYDVLWATANDVGLFSGEL